MLTGHSYCYEYSPTWRSPLYLNAGISLLAAVWGLGAISPDSRDQMPRDRRVDWIGCFLVSCGLVLVVFVLGQGTGAPRGWRTPCEWLCLFYLEFGS